MSGYQMWLKNNIGNLLILISFIPLGFLIYTILHLKDLNIKITHPRVIVEATLFLIIGAIGFYIMAKI